MSSGHPFEQTLRALAASRGVGTEYWDWQGTHVEVSAGTITAVLTALGLDVSTPERAAATLAQEADRAWRTTLPPTVVVRAGQAGAGVEVHVPQGDAGRVRVRVELEHGGQHELAETASAEPPRLIDGVPHVELRFALPAQLPIGWHHLEATTPTGVHTATLLVTPRRLTLPIQRPEWGLMSQVYALSSDTSWGMGDLADLAGTAQWGAERGAGFVLVNPLHAAQPISPIEASPYRPVSRRFASPLYLRPELIAEAAGVELEDLRQQRPPREPIDRDAVWALKRQALRRIYAVARSPQRQAAFEAFRATEGAGLTSFATWCALAETHGLPWRHWPEALHDPDSPAVTRFAAAHADDVDFHAWLQWQLAEQLAEVQRGARAAGMNLGVIHDLAVGVHPDGADTWALGPALARGVSVGAPPDQFNQLGQNWQQPPWRPDALAELGYAPYRDMLRSVLRDAGGIRVDHVMGLFRLWWVPEGRPASEGTYVYYDHEAMVGALALEAERVGAMVIGEDLGVVEPRVREHLRELDMLGTSILWFEWADGRPLAPEYYRRLCLASVTTHDLPPSAGYLALEHVAIRERLGLLTRSAAEERAVEQRAIEAVCEALRAHDLLGRHADEESIVEALYGYLAQSPALLLGVAVPDLVGDRRAVNQPGTDTEYPNWKVPVSDTHGRVITLAELTASPRAQALVEAIRRVRR